MEQIGEVVELRGKQALVRIKRTSACGENCSSCSGECKPISSVVRTTNGLSAKVGDTVKLQMNTGAFLILAFIGYILPIIVAVAVYVIAGKFTSNTIIQDASAVLSILLLLLMFYLLDKIPKKPAYFTSRIIKILR